jgi:hypothetical protein
MIHEPNRKHGADTYKGPYLTEVNDNGTVQLRVPTHTVEPSSRPGISEIYALITRPDLRLKVMATPTLNAS